MNPIFKPGLRNLKSAIILSALLYALCSSAAAQQAGKVYRVGYLSGGFASSTFNIDAVRRELRELGYVEGKNISFVLRYAEDKSGRSPALADELVRLKVDVIIAGGSNDTQAAKKATQTIPIVFTDAVSDPVARGLVESLARPGGNVTGFYSMADVLAGKRLEMLKECIPKLSRVAVLWYPTSVTNEPQWTESQLAARHLGLQLHSMKIGRTDTYESAFKEAIKTGSTALALIRHRLSHTTNQRRILELTAKYRLPAIYYREDFVEQGGLMSYGAAVRAATKEQANALLSRLPPGTPFAHRKQLMELAAKSRLPVGSGQNLDTEAGGLMSYGWDRRDLYRRAATYVDKILKGTKPADLPVERPTKFEFVINLKAAKQIGVTIPPNVLARADKVIK